MPKIQNLKRKLSVDSGVVARQPLITIKNDGCKGGRVTTNGDVRLVLETQKVKSLTRETSSKPFSSNAKHAAVSFLDTIGISVENELVSKSYTSSPSFSLLPLRDLKIQTEAPISDSNPNIFDSDLYGKIKNVSIKMNDKFPNTASDPIYELDDDLPDSQKVKASSMKNIPNTINFTSTLIKQNNMGKVIG